jgi:hypothetical protein
MRVPRILLDLRETASWRGYHLMAALYLITESLRTTELWRFGGDDAEEEIAWRSFVFDTGVPIERWDRRPRFMFAFRRPFDLYVAAANTRPGPIVIHDPRRLARRSLLALLLEEPGTPADLSEVVINGHDTAAFAARILAELQVGRGEGPAA